MTSSHRAALTFMVMVMVTLGALCEPANAQGNSELRDVQFVNLLTTEVLLFWELPNRQGLRFMQAIPAGATHPQRTVETHRFQGISVDTGELVGVYDIYPETTYVEMRGRVSRVVTIRNAYGKDIVVYRVISGWGVKRESRVMPGGSVFVDGDENDKILAVDALSDEMLMDEFVGVLFEQGAETPIVESRATECTSDSDCEWRGIDSYEDAHLGPVFEDMATTVPVIVFQNGGNNTGQEPSVHMRVPRLRSGMGLVLLKRHAGPLLDHKANPVRDHEKDLSVYTRFGVEITDTADLKHNEMLFLVPKSDYFIWPGIRVGYQVVIPNLYNQDGQAIVLETLSLMPRVFSLSGFLTSKECTSVKKLIDQSRAQLAGLKSLAPDEASSDRRTLAQWVHGTPDIQEKIIKRAKRVTKVRNRKLYEPFQIVKYEGGGKSYFHAHTDYYTESSERPHVKEGKNRLLTMLLYLNTVKDGGETVFPRADLSPTVSQTYGMGPWAEKSDCSLGLRIKPEKGKAILFYHLKADAHIQGATDERSLHGACPVYSGLKYSVNLFVKNRFYL